MIWTKHVICLMTDGLDFEVQLTSQVSRKSCMNALHLLIGCKQVACYTFLPLRTTLSLLCSGM